MLEDYKEEACRERQFNNIGQSKVLDKSQVLATYPSDTGKTKRRFIHRQICVIVLVTGIQGSPSDGFCFS